MWEKRRKGDKKKNQALFVSWIIRINSKAFLPEKRVWNSSKSSGKSENRRNKGHTVFNFGFLKGHRVQGLWGRMSSGQCALRVVLVMEESSL